MPRPGELAEYGEVDPSFPERIMRMAEVNIHGRHELIAKSVNTESTSTLLASGAITFVSVGGLVGGFVLIVLGYDPVVLVSWVPGVLQGMAAAWNAIRKKSDD